MIFKLFPIRASSSVDPSTIRASAAIFRHISQYTATFQKSPEFESPKVLSGIEKDIHRCFYALQSQGSSFSLLFYIIPLYLFAHQSKDIKTEDALKTLLKQNSWVYNEKALLVAIDASQFNLSTTYHTLSDQLASFTEVLPKYEHLASLYFTFSTLTLQDYQYERIPDTLLQRIAGFFTDRPFAEQYCRTPGAEPFRDSNLFPIVTELFNNLSHLDSVLPILSNRLGEETIYNPTLLLILTNVKLSTHTTVHEPPSFSTFLDSEYYTLIPKLIGAILKSSTDSIPHFNAILMSSYRFVDPDTAFELREACLHRIFSIIPKTQTPLEPFIDLLTAFLKTPHSSAFLLDIFKVAISTPMITQKYPDLIVDTFERILSDYTNHACLDLKLPSLPIFHNSPKHPIRLSTRVVLFQAILYSTCKNPTVFQRIFGFSFLNYRGSSSISSTTIATLQFNTFKKLLSLSSNETDLFSSIKMGSFYTPACQAQCFDLYLSSTQDPSLVPLLLLTRSKTQSQFLSTLDRVLTQFSHSPSLFLSHQVLERYFQLKFESFKGNYSSQTGFILKALKDYSPIIKPFILSHFTRLLCTTDWDRTFDSTREMLRFRSIGSSFTPEVLETLRQSFFLLSSEEILSLLPNNYSTLFFGWLFYNRMTSFLFPGCSYDENYFEIIHQPLSSIDPYFLGNANYNTDPKDPRFLLVDFFLKDFDCEPTPFEAASKYFLELPEPDQKALDLKTTHYDYFPMNPTPYSRVHIFRTRLSDPQFCKDYKPILDVIMYKMIYLHGFKYSDIVMLQKIYNHSLL